MIQDAMPMDSLPDTDKLHDLPITFTAPDEPPQLAVSPVPLQPTESDTEDLQPTVQPGHQTTSTSSMFGDDVRPPTPGPLCPTEDADR